MMNLLKKKSVIIVVVALAILAIAFWSWSNDSNDRNILEQDEKGHAHEDEGEEHEEHEGEEHEDHEGEEPDEHEGEKPDEHEGHGHGDDEISDLDRPVAELFEASCEHNIKTHECDECRYEVGVVKAPANLFEGGLLKTVKAEKKAVAAPLRLTGEIQFDERRITHISTQVDGIVRKVKATLGDEVTEGQALLEIESVEVGNAKALYHEALAMEKLARKNNNRIEALHKEGISSEKEMLRARQELDAAQIRVKAAKGTLHRIGMSGSNARGISLVSSSGKLILRAPADGTILEMHAVSGEIAKSGESLITIGNNSAIWVWADLYEKDLARVYEQKDEDSIHAEVSVKAFPNQTFSGTVDFISPAMSESSRTVKVRVAVPNPDGKLLAGMFADVDIFLSGNQQALSLPKNALLEDDGRTFVFVHHKGDYYVRRPVTPGREVAGWVEITDGLQGNEIVVAEGAFLLKSDVLRSKMGAGCAD